MVRLAGWVLAPILTTGCYIPPDTPTIAATRPVSIAILPPIDQTEPPAAARERLTGYLDGWHGVSVRDRADVDFVIESLRVDPRIWIADETLRESDDGKQAIEDACQVARALKVDAVVLSRIESRSVDLPRCAETRSILDALDHPSGEDCVRYSKTKVESGDADVSVYLAVVHARHCGVRDVGFVLDGEGATGSHALHDARKQARIAIRRWVPDAVRQRAARYPIGFIPRHRPVSPRYPHVPGN